jgi:hypothetical protein
LARTGRDLIRRRICMVCRACREPVPEAQIRLAYFLRQGTLRSRRLDRARCSVLGQQSEHAADGSQTQLELGSSCHEQLSPRQSL